MTKKMSRTRPRQPRSTPSTDHNPNPRANAASRATVPSASTSTSTYTPYANGSGTSSSFPSAPNASNYDSAPDEDDYLDGGSDSDASTQMIIEDDYLIHVKDEELEKKAAKLLGLSKRWKDAEDVVMPSGRGPDGMRKRDGVGEDSSPEGLLSQNIATLTSLVSRLEETEWMYTPPPLSTLPHDNHSTSHPDPIYKTFGTTTSSSNWLDTAYDPNYHIQDPTTSSSSHYLRGGPGGGAGGGGGTLPNDIETEFSFLEIQSQRQRSSSTRRSHGGLDEVSASLARLPSGRGGGTGLGSAGLGMGAPGGNGAGITGGGGGVSGNIGRRTISGSSNAPGGRRSLGGNSSSGGINPGSVLMSPGHSQASFSMLGGPAGFPGGTSSSIGLRRI